MSRRGVQAQFGPKAEEEVIGVEPPPEILSPNFAVQPKPQAVVVAVNPQLADTPKPFGHAVKDLNGTVAVGYIRRMHFQHQHQALRIHDQVAFAPLDLLAAVISTRWSTDATRFDRLTIDDRRTRLATEATPYRFTQGGVNSLPNAQQSPQAGVVEGCLPLLSIVREPSPAAVGFGHIEHRIE